MNVKTILASPARMIPVLVVAVVIAVGAGIIILTADSPSTSAPVASGPAEGGSGKVVKVDIKDFKFDPPAITVKKGSKIEWTNDDSANHTATADDSSFDTGTIEQGKTIAETFSTPGTFTYHCDFHAFMTATVKVK